LPEEHYADWLQKPDPKLCLHMDQMYIHMIYLKDHIEEKDFQEHFLLSSTGQSQNLSVEYATSASQLQANWRMFSWFWGVGYSRF